MDHFHHLLNLNTQIRRIWGELDEKIAKYASEARYSCPSGCGTCCEYPDIEVSVLDCIPTAWDLRRLPPISKSTKTSGSSCPFYQGGSCGVYATRPTLCRLFSFSSRRNKSGEAELVLCGRLRETLKCDLPELAAGSAKDILLLAPMIDEWSSRVATLDFTLGQRRLPIAAAMEEASAYLEHAGAYLNTMPQNTRAYECEDKSRAQ